MTRNIELAYQAMWDVRLYQVVDRVGQHDVDCPPASARVEYMQTFRRCVIGWTALHIVVHPADRALMFVPLESDGSDEGERVQARFRGRVDEYVNEGLNMLQVRALRCASAHMCICVYVSV